MMYACMKALFIGLVTSVLVACGGRDYSIKAPEFSDQRVDRQKSAMLTAGLPPTSNADSAAVSASLWSHGRQSLLGDRRALNRGDILTVLVEIDDEAEISNGTSVSNSSSRDLSISGLFGLPEYLNGKLPEGASLDEAIGIGSSSDRNGSGSVQREESLTLKIAATIVDVLPNGVLSIMGSQEIRVNNEMRELLISGFIRPSDISRKNEVTYEKIASARISYGGRGNISAETSMPYGFSILNGLSPY